MKNVLYQRVIQAGLQKPDGTLVGAAVTEETNGWAVWRLYVADKSSGFRYDLQSFITWGRDDALEEAVGVLASLRSGELR